MIVAIWIIAVCEVIRAIQNAIAIHASSTTKEMMDKAYDEIAKSAESIEADVDMAGFLKFLNGTALSHEDYLKLCEEYAKEKFKE